MTSLDAERDHRFQLDLIMRLASAEVAGCTCLTKTGEIKHHATMCHYRLFNEARDEIVKLSKMLREAR
jgi:hypothetical protein